MPLKPNQFPLLLLGSSPGFFAAGWVGGPQNSFQWTSEVFWALPSGAAIYTGRLRPWRVAGIDDETVSLKRFLKVCKLAMVRWMVEPTTSYDSLELLVQSILSMHHIPTPGTAHALLRFSWIERSRKYGHVYFVYMSSGGLCPSHPPSGFLGALGLFGPWDLWFFKNIDPKMALKRSCVAISRLRDVNNRIRHHCLTLGIDSQTVASIKSPFQPIFYHFPFVFQQLFPKCPPHFKKKSWKRPPETSLRLQISKNQCPRFNLHPMLIVEKIVQGARDPLGGCEGQSPPLDI